MRITGIRLFRYRLPFKTPIRTIHGDHSFREGIVVQLQDEADRVTYGEAAPLPGFSVENIQQVQKELTTIKPFLVAGELPSDLEKLDGGFEKWLGDLTLSSSARFAIESAVVEMVAAGKGASLTEILGMPQPSDVKVNALLTGTNEEVLSKAAASVADGYVCLKLKIGHLPVGETVELVRQVRDKVGDTTSLRLDANRAYVIGEALELTRQLASFDIDYIEEPARNLNQLRKLLGDSGEKARVALDESLLEISPEDLSLGYPIRAVVIKPTMLGLEKAFRFARSAAANGVAAVISSSYESSVGIRVLAATAAVVGAGVPAGLDTLEAFADDLLENPVQIQKGHINTECFRNPTSKIRFDNLEEIVDE